MTAHADPAIAAVRLAAQAPAVSPLGLGRRKFTFGGFWREKVGRTVSVGHPRNGEQKSSLSNRMAGRGNLQEDTTKP